MKKLILPSFLITAMAFCSEQPQVPLKFIILPSKAVLQKRLNDKGLGQLAQDENILALADAKRTAIGVLTSIECALFDSEDDSLDKRRKSIFDCILADCPEALKELNDAKLID